MSEQQQEEIVRQIGGMLQNFQEKMQIQVDDIKEQMTDMRMEMRDRDNQRHAEIMALQKKHDADIRELRAESNAKFDKIDAKFAQIDEKFDKIDEKFERMDNKIDNLINHSHNLFVAASVGIGAVLIGIVTLIFK